MASIDVTKQIVMKCSLPFAWEYVAEPLNMPDWHENILTAKWKSPKPLKIGSQFEFSAKFMGRNLSYAYEVKELEPEKLLVMESVDSPFPMKTSYKLHALFEGTIRISVRNEGESAGAFKLLGGMIRGSMISAMEKDLEKLKGILERRFKEKNW